MNKTQYRSVKITPKQHINGNVYVPGSKSITNRALLCASLAKGESILTNCLLSDDTERMIDCLSSLGVKIERNDKTLKVNGNGGNFTKTKDDLYVGNAGTAMRFLTAISTLVPGETTITGDDRMQKRPIQDLLKGLNSLGIRAFSKNNDKCPPVSIPHYNMTGGEISISGQRSSQYISALFFIAPFASKKDTVIKITDGLVSKPYIDITIEVLRDFGITVINDNYSTFTIKNSQKYISCNYDIEGDASSASYFLAMAAVSEGNVTIKNVGSKSIQGDKKLALLLGKMGCSVKYSDTEINLQGSEKLSALGKVNLEDMPDSAMTLAMVCALAKGTTEITGIENLKIKECNRIKAIVTELRKCGLKAEEIKDGIVITGGTLNKAQIETYNDHRMAMCFAVLATQQEGIEILNPECVNKTYKEFWNDMKKLNIKIQ